MSHWNYLKSKRAHRIFSQFLTCFGFHFLLNKITTTWREKYKNSIWKIWKKLANKYKSSVIRKTRGEIYLKKLTIRRNAWMPFERLWCGDSLEACQERGIFISIKINQPPCSSSVFHRSCFIIAIITLTAIFVFIIKIVICDYICSGGKGRLPRSDCGAPPVWGPTHSDADFA